MRTRKMLESLRAKDALENPARVVSAFDSARTNGWTLRSVEQHLNSQPLRNYAQAFDARFGFAQPRSATGKAQGYVARLVRGF